MHDINDTAVELMRLRVDMYIHLVWGHHASCHRHDSRCRAPTCIYLSLLKNVFYVGAEL